MNDAAKTAQAVVKVAAADAAKQEAATAVAQATGLAATTAEQPKPRSVALASTTAPEQSGIWVASTQNVKKWLHLGAQDQATQPLVAEYVPDQPIPTDVPLPPRRDASPVQGDKPQHVALRTPLPPSKPGETSPAQAAAADAAPASVSSAPAPAATTLAQ